MNPGGSRQLQTHPGGSRQLQMNPGGFRLHHATPWRPQRAPHTVPGNYRLLMQLQKAPYDSLVLTAPNGSRQLHTAPGGFKRLQVAPRGSLSVLTYLLHYFQDST
jgi:hypothetical protein